MTGHDWRERAACATGPDLWHSPERADRAIAVTICMACPVRAECHVEAQAARRDGVTLHGVWAGVDHGKGTGRHSQPIGGRREVVCGTEAGAKRHQRAGEPVCPACLDGQRIAMAKRKAALRARGGTGAPTECGTRSGHRGHRVRGEDSCDACREAERAYWRDLRERRRKGRQEAAS